MDYRKNREYEEAKNLMLALVEADPANALYQYHLAWSYDNLGLEKEAVPHYEKAIKMGLKDEDLAGALLGLGSTYRTLGRYEDAKEIFESAIEKFPQEEQFKVFYAMTLYNLKHEAKAMEILLHTLLRTTSNESILKYNNAIAFYSDKLDQKWD